MPPKNHIKLTSTKHVRKLPATTINKLLNDEIEKAIAELLESDLPFVEKLSILTKAGLIDPVSLIIKACNEALQEEEKDSK